MEWLFPSVVATLVGTLVLTTIYFYLYTYDRQKFFLIWGVGWLVYIFRFVFMLLVIAGVNKEWDTTFEIAHQLATLLSGILLLHGTFLFTTKPMPRRWYVLTIIAAVWVVYSSYWHLPFLWQTLPSFLFLGIIYIWTGIVFLGYASAQGGSMAIAGWAFILWGLHKIDYPFVRPIDWLAPWGYLLAATLGLTVGIGMLLAYYEKIRQVLTAEMQERLKAEGNARESERQLMTLMGNLQGMAYRCRNDQQWTMQFVSQGCFDLTGYGPADLMQNQTVAYNDLIHPEDRERVWQEVQQALAHQQPFKLRYRIRTASGEEKRVYEQGVGVSPAEDGIQVLEGFVTDITALELAQKELGTQLRLLTLSSEVGTILAQGGAIETIMQRCCESLVRHLGAAFARIWLLNAEEQVLELKASAGMYTHTNGEHGRIPMGQYKIGVIAAGQKPHLTNSVIGDSLVHDQAWAIREKMIAFAGHPLMVAGNVVGVIALFARHPFSEVVSQEIAAVADGVAMGIQRHRDEEALLTSETRLKTLVQTIPDLVWLKDPNGVYLTCNPRFERFFGAKESEIVGKTDYDFVDQELADFFRQRDQAAIEAGRPSVNEEEVIYADDGHQELLETIKTPMIDPDGRVVGVLGIARDITERKKAIEARENLEKQLRQAQKMEAIGTLAGGIAHDFNNILSAIYGYVEFAKEDISQPDMLRQDLDKIFKAAERAKQLVQQILTFGRKTEQNAHPLQVALVVRDAFTLLRSSIPTTIEMQEEITSQALVLADPTQMHQVVVNLCTNAYHAMRETGGILRVAVQDIEIAASEASPSPELATGRYVLLEVSDTGIGMDEATREKIFEPYFTTKRLGDGTGLGLAVVHGVVQRQGGVIRVSSVPGQGTTMHVYLPVYDGDHDGVLVDDVEASPVGDGSETIMFVDDEAALTEIAAKNFERHGYGVRVFNDAMQAFQELQQHPDTYDLLVTDMTMPRMTGLELGIRAMKIRPDLPVILCSGYSDLVNRDKALTVGVKEYCEKPVSLSRILRIIRKVLDDAKG